MGHCLFLKLISATQVILLLVALDMRDLCQPRDRTTSFLTLSSTRFLAQHKYWTSKIGELKGAPRRTNFMKPGGIAAPKRHPILKHPTLRFVHPDLGIGGAELAP